ncbi:MAG: hypothetical protein CMJ75_03115 [Planctomycetaceae bacterium]|nr:hypothetical protein [Planctomycetaceae bacterium]
MKNWMALLTIVAATSLGAVGCSQPENTESKVDPTATVDEGVTATPDPTGAGGGDAGGGDAGK